MFTVLHRFFPSVFNYTVLLNRRIKTFYQFAKANLTLTLTHLYSLRVTDVTTKKSNVGPIALIRFNLKFVSFAVQ